MLFNRKLAIILLFFSIFSVSESANILGVFDYPSYSHQIVYHTLIKALSDQGHHLTILTTDSMHSNHPNITEIILENSYDVNINFVASRGIAGLKLSYELVKANFMRNDQQLSQPKVRNLIENHQNYKFDLLIIEFVFGTSMLAFAELFNCPVIGFSAIELSVQAHEILGNSVNPAIHPELIFPAQHAKLTFFERISSFIWYIGSKCIFEPYFNHLGDKIVIMWKFYKLDWK